MKNLYATLLYEINYLVSNRADVGSVSFRDEIINKYNNSQVLWGYLLSSIGRQIYESLDCCQKSCTKCKILVHYKGGAGGGY